jgi:predicted DNA-binding transcriptional regulator AlpA
MEMTAMVRETIRLPGVCAAFGDAGKSTIYDWVETGLLPAPTKMGGLSLWFTDQISAIQQAWADGGEAAVRAVVAQMTNARGDEGKAAAKAASERMSGLRKAAGKAAGQRKVLSEEAPDAGCAA